MAVFQLDGLDLKKDEQGPDGGPYRISWSKAHRIQVKEIPYFRDKSIVTSGKGDPKGEGNPGSKYSGVLWKLQFQVRCITYNRWSFFKAVAETPGPHMLVSAFGAYSMYLERATFDQTFGEREPGKHGLEGHMIGESESFVEEYVGTWTFEMVEVHH